MWLKFVAKIKFCSSACVLYRLFVQFSSVANDNLFGYWRGQLDLPCSESESDSEDDALYECRVLYRISCQWGEIIANSNEQTRGSGGMLPQENFEIYDI